MNLILSNAKRPASQRWFDIAVSRSRNLQSWGNIVSRNEYLSMISAKMERPGILFQSV